LYIPDWSFTHKIQYWDVLDFFRRFPLIRDLDLCLAELPLAELPLAELLLASIRDSRIYIYDKFTFLLL
jgi:hypothetical protein